MDCKARMARLTALSYSVKCPKGRIIVEGNRFGATKQRNVWHMGDGGADWLEIGENEMQHP